MKVLLLTDIHGDVSNLESIIDREEDFDVALCAGDLSDSSKFEDYNGRLEKVLKVFDRQGKLSKMVPGNMDREQDCVRNLINYRMNLHKKVASFQTFDVVGFGGGITPFGTPFEPEEKEIETTLDTLYDRMGDNRKVGVVHQPPYGCSVDMTDGNHVGSQRLRKLVSRRDFDLLVTGHIHEGRSIDTCEGTKIVNPGPVYEGYYAVARIDEDIEVGLRSL